MFNVVHHDDTFCLRGVPLWITDKAAHIFDILGILYQVGDRLAMYCSHLIRTTVELRHTITIFFYSCKIYIHGPRRSSLTAVFPLAGCE